MGLEDTTRVALTLDSVELMARGLEAFDDSGTDFSNPTSTSCSDEKKWDLGEELLDAFASVSFHYPHLRILDVSLGSPIPNSYVCFPGFI